MELLRIIHSDFALTIACSRFQQEWQKGMPGKPDIVLRKYRTAIFVNGCFWYRHHVEWEKRMERRG